MLICNCLILCAASLVLIWFDFLFYKKLWNLWKCNMYSLLVSLGSSEAGPLSLDNFVSYDKKGCSSYRKYSDLCLRGFVHELIFYEECNEILFKFNEPQVYKLNRLLTWFRNYSKINGGKMVKCSTFVPHHMASGAQ